MAHAEESITIARPVQTVYDFLLDGSNNPLWLSPVTDIRLLSGPSLGVGSVFKQGLKGPSGRIDADYEIVACKPYELIQFQVCAGPVQPAGTYHFESLGTSTKLTFALDYQPKGLAKLMDPVITKTMQAEMDDLSNLKTYLEKVA